MSTLGFRPRAGSNGAFLSSRQPPEGMADFTIFGRWIIMAGLVLLILGGALYLLGRAGIPLGRLPGDFRLETEGFSCVVPLASSLLISLILTVLLNLILRGLGR